MSSFAIDGSTAERNSMICSSGPKHVVYAPFYSSQIGLYIKLSSSVVRSSAASYFVCSIALHQRWCCPIYICLASLVYTNTDKLYFLLWGCCFPDKFFILPQFSCILYTAQKHKIWWNILFNAFFALALFPSSKYFTSILRYECITKSIHIGVGVCILRST